MPTFKKGDRILHTVIGYTGTVIKHLNSADCIVIRDDGKGYFRSGYSGPTWNGNPAFMVHLTPRLGVDIELDKRFKNAG